MVVVVMHDCCCNCGGFDYDFFLNCMLGGGIRGVGSGN